LLKNNSNESNPTFKTKLSVEQERPIECMLNSDGEIIVIDGNNMLGLSLGGDKTDNINVQNGEIEQIFS